MLVLITPWYIVYVFYRSYRRSVARSRKRRRSGSHYSAWRLRPSHRMACRHAENLTDDIGDYLSYPVTWVITALAFIIYYIYITHKTIAGSSKKHVPKL